MDYRSFSNVALLARLRDLAACERSATCDFVACLAEADRRAEAIIGEGYPSLYEFCVRDLKLAESTAYKRVKAARLIRSRPEILRLLGDGSINLSTLCLVASHLDGHPEFLEGIKGKSKREVEEMVASLGGPREIPDRVRPLAPIAPPRDEEGILSFLPPSTTPEASRQAESVQTPAVHPPSPGGVPADDPRLEFRFVAGPRFVRVVEKLRALLWHKFPAGRLEDLLFEAANDFVARRDPVREPRRSANPKPERARSRHIPARIRREVWRRDGGRCAYSGTSGRCGESRGLEIDHVRPWALGGRSDQAANLRLLCRAHNQSEATRVFGGPRVSPGRLVRRRSAA